MRYGFYLQKQQTQLKWYEITVNLLKQMPDLVQSVKDTIDIIKGKKTKTAEDEKVLAYLQQVLAEFEKERKLEKERQMTILIALGVGFAGLILLSVLLGRK
jgi:hypothetical protein